MLDLLEFILFRKYYCQNSPCFPNIISNLTANHINMFRRIHDFNMLWPASHHMLFDVIRFHITHNTDKHTHSELFGAKFIWIFENFPTKYPFGYHWLYPWEDGLPNSVWVRNKGVLYDPTNTFRIYGKTGVINTFPVNYTPEFEQRSQGRFGRTYYRSLR